MGSEKFCLKWKKYNDNIVSAFQSLLETEALSDVTLFCEGHTFKAHRIVLAASSTHFETLFNNAPNNTNPTQLFVILDGTRADDLQILLQFMYRGEAYLHEHRLKSVLNTADILQIKGLCKDPENSYDDRNLSGGGSLGPPSSGAGSASNARMWSSSPHEPSPHRNTIGIMGHMRPSSHIRKEHRGEHRASDLHRDLDHQRLLRQANLEPGGHHSSRAMSPPPADHGFAFPTSRTASGSALSESYGGIYGYRGGIPLHSGSSGRPFSPSERDRSPPQPRGRNYGSSSSTPIPVITKEERDDFYEPRGGGSRCGSIGHHDRGTPASDKASDRHTPVSHHGGDRDLDQRSNRSSPPMPPVATTSKFPSDSTSDYAKAASSSTLKDRPRSCESTADQIRRMELASAGSEAESGSNEKQRFLLHEYRRESDQQPQRTRSPSGGRSADSRVNEDEATRADQVANLEAFRRIAQAHVEREHFLPGAAGVLHGGINATIATQGLTGTSASDLMRLAVPVRDPDNNGEISGSGSKLRCPFCERTYGYETNLRAHIRQRHQGIRVSCPYCPRTFTRNNTVRRHIAREHRNASARIPTKFGSTRVMPDPIRLNQIATAAAAMNASSSGLRALSSSLQDDNGNGRMSPTSTPTTSTSAT